MDCEQVRLLRWSEKPKNMVQLHDSPLYIYPYGVMVAQQPPKLFGESSNLSRGAFYLKTYLQTFLSMLI